LSAPLNMVTPVHGGSVDGDGVMDEETEAEWETEDVILCETEVEYETEGEDVILCETEADNETEGEGEGEALGRKRTSASING